MKTIINEYLFADLMVESKRNILFESVFFYIKVKNRFIVAVYFLDLNILSMIFLTCFFKMKTKKNRIRNSFFQKM